MKMDAMQKRRIHKVSVAHFVLSVCFGIIAFNFAVHAHGFSGPPEARLAFGTHIAWYHAWASVWITVFSLLQPQFWFLDGMERFSVFSNLFSFLQAIPVWVTVMAYLISVPLWSFCFSWIFVKLDNWLNHFPVLGKRVF
jgi:hypothetical protein